MLGNVVGANILNLLWVLGAAAIVRPQAIDRPTLVFNLPFAFFITAAMLLMGLQGKCFGRKKGLVLLGLYVLYTAFLYFFVYRGNNG